MSCHSDFIGNYGGIVWVYQQQIESAARGYVWLNLSCSFQMPDRCFMWICGTAPSWLKPSATRWGMMIFQCYWYYVCCVLWMCYECVMSVLCVMNVLWMCYGCVMDVWGMCYGCVRDVMDALGIVINKLRMYVWWMNDGYFISTV